MGYATELRANEPGEVIWCGIKDNSECLVKEFRFTRGKAFELKFDVIQHVFQEDDNGSTMTGTQT